MIINIIIIIIVLSLSRKRIEGGPDLYAIAGAFDRCLGEERAGGLEAHLQIGRRAVVHAGPVHRREGPSPGHEVGDQTQVPGIHVDTVG